MGRAGEYIRKYIRVHITDGEALASLDCRRVAAYLRENGWTDRGTVGERPISVYEKVGAALQIPHHNEFADHGSVMSRALEAIAQDEDRSELDVFADIGGSPERDKTPTEQSTGGGRRKPGSLSQPAMSKRRRELEITTLTGRITGLERMCPGEKYAGEMQVQADSSLENTIYRIMVPTGMIDWVPANHAGKKVTVEVDTDWAGPEYVMRSVHPAQEHETEGRNGDPPGITLARFHQNEIDETPHSRGPWDVYELPCPSCGQTYGGVHPAASIQTSTLGHGKDPVAEIDLYCEQGCTPTLVIGNHKGTGFAFWRTRVELPGGVQAAPETV